MTADAAPQPSGIPTTHIVTLAAVGIMGFLANDFVAQRDQSTADLEKRLREIISTASEMTGSAIGELKTEVRELARQNTAAVDALERRMFDIEAAHAATRRELDLKAARVERLSSMIRERTLDRIQDGE